MAKKQDESIDDLIGDFQTLQTSTKPKFVANSIIYVDGQESDESSDEEYDSSDEAIFDDLDIGDKSTLPYRTYTIKTSKAKKMVGQEIYSTPIGFVEPTEVETYEGAPNNRESTIVKPFLDNLYQNGFEQNSTGLINDTVSASLLLNRPLSLSTRKNNLLTNELQAKTESAIVHNKFSIFWKFNWYDANNKIVEYDTVRTFYKKLKRYDASYETTKAEEFRSHCESGIAVPYQGLRELAKNHEKTKELVRKARIDSPGSDIYLSIVDGDTVSFNGIYSAYLRIYAKAEIAPTIMSTCYEFTKEREVDTPFVKSSELCRKIRVATAKFVKLGVYITEPNVCILVPEELDTLGVSFIDKTIKLGNAESVALMRNLIKSRGIDNLAVVISDDNPLLTAIPLRARNLKAHKEIPIKFSQEAELGLGLTEKDFVSFKQISQSHVHEGVWLDNLYINKAIKLKAGCHFKFKGLVTKYLKEEITNEEEASLLQIVSENDLACIKRAYDEKEKAIQLYKKDNLQNADQRKLLDFINQHDDFDLGDFTSEFLQIIATADIQSLLEDNVLDLEELSDVRTDVLKELLYENLVIEELVEENITFADCVEMYHAARQYGKKFSDTIEEFISAVNNHEFTVSEIIERYKENPLHLTFMSGDPTDIVLENSDDETIVSFGIENYDIDIEWIREELYGERDDYSAALMDFDRITGEGNFDEYDEDQDFLGDYDIYEG